MGEEAVIHTSADATTEPDQDGWYRARCQCGFEFGPAPGIVEVVDVLMEHAFEMGQAVGG